MILVVGDDRTLRGRLGEELGCDPSVLFAESGHEAIAIIHRASDLTAVVTALAIRGQIGAYDILRVAQARNARCRRVVVTDRPLVVLDHDTSPLVDMVFGVPWIQGTLRAYLDASSAHG